MNVLLISPAMKNQLPPSYYDAPPMALISIATYLSQCGHNVKVIDRLIKVTNIKKIISEFKPDFVGITLMYVKTIDDACKCSKISHEFGAKVVWGGHLATDALKLVLNENFVDFVITGEGEFAWQELLNTYKNCEDYNNINGLAYKKNGQIVINQARDFCDLADLPPMDFRFINPKNYFLMFNFCKNQVRLYSSKGCPGRCAFCFNAHFNHSVHRKRPIEQVIGEIRSMVVDYGADGIYFEDEIFRTNSKDIADVCTAFKNSGIDFVWGFKMRIGMLSAEDFKILYESGCRWIFFGVESGSEQASHNMHKGIILNNVESDILNCAEAGILPIAAFIVGLPDETCEQMKETIKLAKSLKNALIHCNYFTLIYGTEYYERFLSEGKIIPVKKLGDLKKYPIIDENLKANYSQIPSRDLKVVRAYLLCWSFQSKPLTGDDSGYSLMKKAAKESFRHINARGLKGIVTEAYGIVRTVMSLGFNLLCFPKVKKKYDLKLNRKRL